jgi:glycosyltransferase involved in cell wall biosynthesis
MNTQKKQKIIWMIDSLRPGGAEQLMVPILKNLKASFDIRVCALQVRAGNPIAKQLEQVGISVDLVEIPNLRTLSNLPKIIRYLRKHSPDLIHTQLQFADILGSTAGRLLNIPTLSTQHTIESDTDLSSAGLRQKLAWFCLKHFSEKVIAVSNQTKEYHRTRGKIQPSKIITLHNGIDILKFTNIPEEKRKNIRELHTLPSDGKIILTVAVLREKKGIQYFLSALPEILSEHPKTYYLIVGDGEYRQNLEQIVKDKSLQKNVLFAGHKTNVPEYLAACDLFVLPTLIDAFPTVLLEAMAAKKPIIASNVGGVPEIIEDEFSGLLVSPTDSDQLKKSCNLLLSNPQKADYLAENGHKIALEKFSINKQVEQLVKIYLEIINE